MTILVLPLALALILLALVLFADAWLESSSGRNQLERALTRTLGMPVHIGGDFSIAFLPSLGVSGTGLFIGDQKSMAPLVQSETFHAELALMPLIDKKVHILALRAAHGQLDPMQFRELRSGRKTTAQKNLELPQIERLQLEDFTISLAGNNLLLRQFELIEFQSGKLSSLNFEITLVSGDTEIALKAVRSDLLVAANAERIDLEVGELTIETGAERVGAITGAFSWIPEQDLLETQLQGQRAGFGSADLSASLFSNSMKGAFSMDFLAAGSASVATAEVSFQVLDEGVDFPSISVSLDQQQAQGHGCLLSGQPQVLNLSMMSEYVNVDLIEPLFSGGDGGNDGGKGVGNGAGMPFELNLKVSATELHVAGAVAYRTEIRSGLEPDCSILSD